MRAGALLLATLLLLDASFARDPFRIGDLESNLKENRAQLAEVWKELADIKEQQKSAEHPPAKAKHLAQCRSELEAAMRILQQSVTETTATLADLRSRLSTRNPCPLCGGKLTRIGSLPQDKKHARKNTVVWDDPDDSAVLVCGNDDTFPLEGPICTRCWSAPCFKTRAWMRFSRDPNSFVIPLAPAIIKISRLFGDPRALRFHQVFIPDGTRIDGVSYLESKLSRESLDAIETYAKENHLEFSQTGRWSAWTTTRHEFKLPAPPVSTSGPVPTP
jgi:hypothetical protein